MREFNFVSFKTTPPTGRFVFSYKLFTWWPIDFTLYFLCFKYFCLTLKCKKEKTPTSWRSLPTITYKYIECILLYSFLYLFFKYIYHFVDFLWILNIVLSLHIIYCTFMLHFVITSNVFLQNSRWKPLFIHCIPMAWVSQKWLLSKKIDNQLFMEVPKKWIMQYSPFLLETKLCKLIGCGKLFNCLRLV